MELNNPSGDYVPIAQSDVPVWLEALVAAMSLLIGSITGAIGAAWRSSERQEAMERRITDKIDVAVDALRRRQDELHRENKTDFQRLEDKIARRPMRQN